MAVAQMPPSSHEGPETQRQREILLAAIELFRARGYHATGMNDIGQAVGLTGPALYRHFASKEDILETALLNASRYMEGKVAPVVDAGLAPHETLLRLVSDLVQVVVDYPAVVAIAITERRHMSERALAIYDRSTRLRETEWVGPLIQLRSDLTENEARLRVRMAQNMVGASVAGSSSLPAAKRVEFLRTAALGILLDDASRPLPAGLPSVVDDDVDDVA